MSGERGRQFGPLLVRPAKEPSPFLKWAGGKSQLFAQMREWFPSEFDVYVEPFLGGGAVFFRLLPDRAILSDLNAELMNVYRTVQSDVHPLMKVLDEHELRKTDKDYYYKVREWIPETLDPVARAARTIFLNKTCYNGLYRVNSKGQFNVPFGRYKNPQLYDEDNLLACSQALQGKLLLAADYQHAMAYARQGDFVYLDPPYQPVSETANFTSYTKDAFTETDQKELASAFSELDRRGCKVILSNSATDYVRELYDGYEIISLKATRAISSKAETRGEIEELLIMNYEV